MEAKGICPGPPFLKDKVAAESGPFHPSVFLPFARNDSGVFMTKGRYQPGAWKHEFIEG